MSILINNFLTNLQVKLCLNIKLILTKYYDVFHASCFFLRLRFITVKFVFCAAIIFITLLKEQKKKKHNPNYILAKTLPRHLHNLTYLSIENTKKTPFCSNNCIRWEFKKEIKVLNYRNKKWCLYNNKKKYLSFHTLVLSNMMGT